MLVIRKEQNEALRKQALERYYDETWLSLTHKYPYKAEKLGTEKLRQLVVEGVERAKGYGITDVVQVSRFMEFLVFISNHLGKTPETRWAKEILENSDLNAGEKLLEIERYLIFKLKYRGPYV